jgi:hypothetical protein
MISFVSRLSIVLFSAFLFVGCSTLPDAQTLAKTTNGKSIAVASRVGSDISLKWIGTTVFNNETKQLKSPEHELDTQIEKALVSALAAGKNYGTVSSVTSKLEPVLKQSRSLGADYLLVISEGVMEDTRFQSNQVYRGLGVFQRSMFNLRPIAINHTVLKGELINVSSGEIIASTVSNTIYASGIMLSSGLDLPAGDFNSLKDSLNGMAIRTSLELARIFGMN